jgi:hypothetical protein
LPETRESLEKYQEFSRPKSDFPCPKSNFPQRLSDFRQRLSAFLNGFPIFLNGFPLSEKSKKIYLRRQVSKRLLFELRISTAAEMT